MILAHALSGKPRGRLDLYGFACSIPVFGLALVGEVVARERGLGLLVFNFGNCFLDFGVTG